MRGSGLDVRRLLLEGLGGVLDRLLVPAARSTVRSDLKRRCTVHGSHGDLWARNALGLAGTVCDGSALVPLKPEQHGGAVGVQREHEAARHHAPEDAAVLGCRLVRKVVEASHLGFGFGLA